MDVRFVVLAVLLVFVSCERRGKSRQKRVCSSKGDKYENKCAFLQATCKPDDASYDTVTLKRSCRDVITKREKTKACVFTKNKDDVETKQNCELLKAKCDKEKVPLKLHEGECGDCSRDNVCPWEQRKSHNLKQKRKTKRSFKRTKISKLRVCTDDGEEFGSICDYHVAKCERYNKDKTILRKRRCSDKSKKKQGKRKTGEVCSSDGQKYKDRCELLAATCKPNDVKFDYVTIARCDSPHVKTKKASICVLSQDEKSVKAMQHCEYLKAKCENKPYPKRFYSGVCGDCTKDNVCPYEKRKKANPGMREQRKRRWRRRPRFSICTSDGTSYKSICDFHVAKCQKFKEDGTILKVVKTNRRRGPRACKAVSNRGKKTAPDQQPPQN